MLTTDDVFSLFAAMRIAYQSQWKHGPEAAEVWRKCLANYGPDRIQRAAEDCMKSETFAKHPPTLPQFLAIIRSRDQRSTTYLPAPKVSTKDIVAQKVLLNVVVKAGGVDDITLRNLVALKNALVEECREVSEEFVRDTQRQLTALANPKEEAA